MNNSSFFGESSQLVHDQPILQPLDGESAVRARELLLRKGMSLRPALTKSEAQDILGFMGLEHFKPGMFITFNSTNDEHARLMMIIAGEANIRMRKQGFEQERGGSIVNSAQSKWFNVGEGSTLGLLHAFPGLSSRFVAQAVSELFVASISRLTLQQMKKHEPVLALRFMEITALELALVALDHEKNLVAMSNVARSMQNHIDEEGGETGPASLF
jgi:CRP-like cAMP-binding protein